MDFTKYDEIIELSYGKFIYQILIIVYKNNNFYVECESDEIKNKIYTLLDEGLNLKITNYKPDELEELIKHYIYR